jgi:hypothetical protein
MTEDPVRSKPRLPPEPMFMFELARDPVVAPSPIHKEAVLDEIAMVPVCGLSAVRTVVP